MNDNDGNPLKNKKHHEREKSMDITGNREKKISKNIGQFSIGKISLVQYLK